jgi:hypothetical protein
MASALPQEITIFLGFESLSTPGGAIEVVLK